MRPLQSLKKFQIVKLLLGFGWKIFIGLMGCGELRDKFLGNYSVVSKALYLGILKNLKIEFLTKKLKNNYFLALLE